MATKKKEDTKKKSDKKVDAEKEAKRKARMEALKNRPAEQRPNGKQIDVITCDKGVVKNFGYPIKSREGHEGVLVTSVLQDEKGNPISTSVTFVPGKLTVKAKKGHGIICSPKNKKDKDDEEVEEQEEDTTAED